MFKVRNNIFIEAEFIESPNSSLRPEGTEPSIIVIHNDDQQHALKEVDAAALAVTKNVEEVVNILKYTIDGKL